MRWKDGDFASAVEDLQEQAGVLPGGLWRDSAVGSHGPGSGLAVDGRTAASCRRVRGAAKEIRAAWSLDEPCPCMVPSPFEAPSSEASWEVSGLGAAPGGITVLMSASMNAACPARL